MDKNQNKTVNKSAKKPEISEEKEYLIRLYNNTKAEIKKVNQYLSALNHDIKTIKKLLEDVK
jgi:septin family protein